VGTYSFDDGFSSVLYALQQATPIRSASEKTHQPSRTKPSHSADKGHVIAYTHPPIVQFNRSGGSCDEDDWWKRFW
jgi:hypothetical protein